jgi:uncharacterized protein (TIGR00369 family)
MDDYKEKILQVCNEVRQNTLMQTLDIEYIDLGENWLLARMPVTSRVYQPDGILHGGATVALAESVASAASYIFVDAQKFFVRGIEISANHLRSISEGFVFARASLIHKGRTTQLWEIRVTDDEGQIISLCKLTTIALPKSD